jgi:hypothetical protein
MDEHTTIESFDVNRLRLEESYGFLNYARLEFNYCKDGLFTPVLKWFTEGMVAFDKVLESPRGSILTAALAAMDAERDRCYRELLERVALGMRHFDGGIAYDSLVVQRIISSYDNPTKLEYMQETGVMLNLIADLKETQIYLILKELGADVWLDRLEQQQQAFDIMYRDRLEQGKAQVGAVKEARMVATRAYQACVTRMNAMIEINGSDEEIEEIVASVNWLIANRKELIRARDTRAAKRKEGNAEEEEVVMELTRAPRGKDGRVDLVGLHVAEATRRREEKAARREGETKEGTTTRHREEEERKERAAIRQTEGEEQQEETAARRHREEERKERAAIRQQEGEKKEEKTTRHREEEKKKRG